MKKLLTILFFFIAITSVAQVAPPGFVPNYTATGYRNLSAYGLFGIPQDTFAIPTNLRNLRWHADKGDTTYIWSVIQQKWIVASGGSGGSTLTISAPLTGASYDGTTPATIGITQSDASHNGYLSSTDWNTFNNKQPAGSYLTAVTANFPLSGAGTSGSHLVVDTTIVATRAYADNLVPLTIYTGDGSLLTNRVISGDSHSLVFNGLTYFEAGDASNNFVYVSPSTFNGGLTVGDGTSSSSIQLNGDSGGLTNVGFSTTNGVHTLGIVANAISDTMAYFAGTHVFGGNIVAPNLATGGSAPTTTGTTKSVITDANGQLSFTDPFATDSFNAQIQNKANIYTKGTFSSDFIYTPDASFNFTDNDINFTSTSAVNADLILTKNGVDTFYHDYERWEISATIRFDTLATSDGGIFFGISNSATGRFGLQIKGHPGAPNDAIGVFIANGANLTSAAGITFTRGDVFFVSIKRDRNFLIGTYSKAGSTPVTFSLQIGNEFTASYNLPRLVSDFRIRLVQGSYSVLNTSINFLDANADIAFLGNSITSGTASTTYQKGYVQTLRAFIPNITDMAGASSMTFNGVSMLRSIILAHPQKVAVMLGTNDFTAGVALDTTKAHYTKIIDTLVANDIIPIIISITPRNSFDVRPFNTWLQATFPSYQYIDLFTGMANSGTYTLKTVYDSGDGLHPNDAGHLYMANSFSEQYSEVYAANATRTLLFNGGGQFQSLRLLKVANTGSTQMDNFGLLLSNAQSATSGAQQISAPLVLEGNGWGTTGTAQSYPVRFRIDMLPVQGSLPTGNLQFSSSVNSANYSVGMSLTSDGRLGIGTTTPTSLLHLAAGTATANTSPLKFTTGTLLTTPETGAVEYQNGLWFIDSSTSVRDTIAGRKWVRDNISGSGGSSQWTTTGSNIYYNTGSVGIGNTGPAANAVLEVTSTTKAILPPRMNTAQMNAIASPVAGLGLIYNTDSSKYVYYNGATWNTLGSGNGTITTNQSTAAIGCTVDGQGGVVTTGSKGFITIPYTGNITKWSLAANASGSIVFDVKRSGTSIIGGGNAPTLSSAQSGNAVPSGWTSVAVTAGDIIEYTVVSVTTISNCSLVLTFVKN